MKNTILLAVAGLNVLLLTALLILSAKPNSVMAQGGGARPGDVVCVSAKPANLASDVVYIFNRVEGKLYAYLPNAANRQAPYGIVAVRDVKGDFK